jgi:hypothetical protein
MSSDERKFNPGEPYWSPVEPVCDEIEICQNPEEFARTFARVPGPAGLLDAVHFSQSEVCKGGSDQFLSNSRQLIRSASIRSTKSYME